VFQLQMASDHTMSIVKNPMLYIADAGLLCALLNIRTKKALLQSLSAGAAWDTLVFALPDCALCR
jgi:hypothetical protein